LIPGAGKREIIGKASKENLREEDSRYCWRQAVLDCTWKLPNVEKVKGANQLTTERTQQ